MLKRNKVISTEVGKEKIKNKKTKTLLRTTKIVSHREGNALKEYKVTNQ